MQRHIAYLKAVLRHKWFVFLEGRKLGVPLLWLILHDWDKFLPSMWLAYANQFYNADGTSRMNTGESLAFRRAWNSHQKRNKHHYQYWLLTNDSGVSECLPMPERHWLEMLADWHGAGRAYNPNWTPAATRDWYLKGRATKLMHPETRLYIERRLGVEDVYRLAEDTLAYRNGKPYKVRV